MATISARSRRSESGLRWSTRSWICESPDGFNEVLIYVSLDDGVLGFIKMFASILHRYILLHSFSTSMLLRSFLSINNYASLDETRVQLDFSAIRCFHPYLLYCEVSQANTNFFTMVKIKVKKCYQRLVKQKEPNPNPTFNKKYMMNLYFCITRALYYTGIVFLYYTGIPRVVTFNIWWNCIFVLHGHPEGGYIQ